MKDSTLAIGGLSALLVFIAAFLAWGRIELLGLAVSGTDGPFQGVWTLILSIAAGLILVWRRLDLSSRIDESSRSMVELGTKTGLLVAGAIIVLLALLDFGDLGDGVTMGEGLLITLLGGIGLVVAAVRIFREAEASGPGA